MKLKTTLQLAALGASAAVCVSPSGPIVGFMLLAITASALQPQKAACRTLTLSVPELLVDVLDAFKLETPELFGPSGFARDFSSKTAVMGDKVTARISKVPTVSDYDAANGGFKASAQEVTALIEDVPVTLDQLKKVTVNIGYLTQLSSKINLYQEAVRNYGYALGKHVIDAALAEAAKSANFSNKVTVPLANVTLDTFDNDVRSQANTQKLFNRGRYCIINTSAASKLGTDDRVRSSLFYAALNGDNGYRRWNNLAGFSFVREYPDMPTGENMWGFAGDNRAICVATRRLDYANAAKALGVPEVMRFDQISDAETGIEMTGVSWQEPGTGNVLVSVAMLFGIAAGKQNGNASTITDSAGIRLVTA